MRCCKQLILFKVDSSINLLKEYTIFIMTLFLARIIFFNLIEKDILIIK